MKEIITRKQAIALCLRRYFTGEPCKYGHVSERSIPSGNCLACPQLPERMEKRRAYMSNYVKEHKPQPYPAHKARKIRNAWRAKYPERWRAHWMVELAVKNGTLVPQPCEKCGNPKVDGHHEDYSKPLEIRWLCALHHKERHMELKQMQSRIEL